MRRAPVHPGPSIEEEGRMNGRGLSNAVVGCSLAAALAAFGCGGDRGNAGRSADANGTGQPAAAGADRAAAPGAAASAPAENNAQPAITLTGCLQKGDGRSDYILTQVNTTPTTVGTSGSTAASGDVVGKEQMRAAEHAYKLAGDRDALEPLVGKQIRVNGTVERGSQLNEHDDKGAMKDRDRSKIDEGDLARVHVASIDSIADACGGTKTRAKGRTRR
jgi:hypothetical protein